MKGRWYKNLILKLAVKVCSWNGLYIKVYKDFAEISFNKNMHTKFQENEKPPNFFSNLPGGLLLGVSDSSRVPGSDINNTKTAITKSPPSEDIKTGDLKFKKMTLKLQGKKFELKAFDFDNLEAPRFYIDYVGTLENGETKEGSFGTNFLLAAIENHFNGKYYFPNKEQSLT